MMKAKFNKLKRPKFVQSKFKKAGVKKEVFTTTLKKNIINSFMFKGHKEVCEKNFKKTLKDIQRFNNKNYKNILKLFIIKLALVFKLKKNSKKRGKKKNIFYNPFLLSNNDFRVNYALRLIKSLLLKNKKESFFNILTQEILNTVMLNKSVSFEQRNDIQNKVLAQRRYFYKFKWYK